MQKWLRIRAFCNGDCEKLICFVSVFITFVFFVFRLSPERFINSQCLFHSLSRRSVFFV